MATKIENTKTRLNYLMKSRNLKQVDILNKCKPYCQKYDVKMNKSDLSQYVSGKVEPSQNKLVILGMALNVSEAWLMGFDVPMERNIPTFQTNNIIDLSQYSNITPISTQKIPLLGEIACGEPIFANEDRESYIEVGTNIRADFCLRAKGDSMIGARIMDGDIVFIKSQPMVENGEIAAVIINDEATLKRVSYHRDKNMLILKAENPKYDDFVYMGEELNHITILGKAVAFQSDL